MGDLLGSPRVSFLFALFFSRIFFVYGFPNSRVSFCISALNIQIMVAKNLRNAGLESGEASGREDKRKESGIHVGCDHTSTKAPDPIRTPKLSVLGRE